MPPKKKESKIGERDCNTHLFYISISITLFALLAWLYYSVYANQITKKNIELSEPCQPNTIVTEVENQLQLEISKLRNSFDEKFKVFNDRLTELGKEHRSANNKLNQLKENLETLREDCSNNITTSLGLMDLMKNNYSSSLEIQDFITQLDRNITDLQSKFHDVLNREKKSAEEIHVLNEHKKKYDQTEKEFIATIARQNNQDNEVFLLQSEVDNIQLKDNKHTEDIEKLKEDDIEIGNKLKQLAENNTKLYMAHSAMAAVLVAYGVVFVIIVFIIHSRRYEPPSISQKEEQTAMEQKFRYLPIAIKVVRSPLDEIGRRNDLENPLCIVSFSSTTQIKHSDMIRSLNDTETERRSYTVNEHCDLKGIPPSKLFVVFVDYNSRNIILESENESGDLRKTTVKAIWKMGGDVVLVYCGDELSKVAGDELYSAKLTSITEHQELKQLESKQRVLSVYQNTFSDHQKRHLRNIMTDLKRSE